LYNPPTLEPLVRHLREKSYWSKLVSHELTMRLGEREKWSNKRTDYTYVRNNYRRSNMKGTVAVDTY